jgi:hypothetical protein
MEKIKVLITGPVNGSINDLHQKLSTLQNSKAGPFDMCFCAGPFFSSSDRCSEAIKSLLENNDTISNISGSGSGSRSKIQLPLPVYFCDAGTLPNDITLPVEAAQTLTKDDAEISIDDESPQKADASAPDVEPRGIVKIAHNLYHLHGISTSQEMQTADILNIATEQDAKHYLTVAFLPPNSRIGSMQTAKLETKTNHPSFVGCDLLLTSDWGQGMACASSDGLTPQDKVTLGLDESTTGVDAGKIVGSYDVAEVASKCRPRYHIAPSLLQTIQGQGEGQGQGQKLDGEDSSSNVTTTSFFIQSLPYTNPPSALTSGVMKTYHTSRFLALCPVVDAKMQKINGKSKKYIHALGIQPLWGMDRVTATAVPENTVVVPCPYTDESYQKDGVENGKRVMNNTNVGLSEAQARRILSEDGPGGQDHRWNIRNRKRPLNDPLLSGGDDLTNCTLFLHGLHNDATGGATLNRESLLKAFHSRGCIQVRYPATDGHPTYCFLDFESHDQAKQCVEQCGGEESVLGIQLTMKWSSGGRRGAPPPPPPAGHVGIFVGAPGNKRAKTRLTEAEAADSTSLFVHLNLASMTEELCARGIQYIGKLAQDMLEEAINADGGEDRVTAEEEPALKVTARQMPGKQNCAFLDFASHAAASMALATLSGSTDGGSLQSDIETDDESLKNALREVQLWWARAKDASSDGTGNANNFQFRSQHFPPDARTDCWFCLASPTCEKHLIVSVLDNCYIAMPKGPVNKNHALIVPVNHSANEAANKRPILGAFLDPTPGAIADLEAAKEKLRKYALEELDSDLFVFERAIPTRGGYHAHINCIPIPKGLGSKIRTSMLSAAAMTNRGSGFELRELQNPDISVTNILKNADEDGLVGYFYAEVPFGENGDIKRFLYSALDQGNGSKKIVPLQFGREVLATVLEDDNLAHWKGCVKSTEVEEEYTQAFRKAFEKYG